jgi:hypothetical protein
MSGEKGNGAQGRDASSEQFQPLRARWDTSIFPRFSGSFRSAAPPGSMPNLGIELGLSRSVGAES